MMSKVANILNMLQLLQNGRKYSVGELAKKLEVGERMIRSYKEELELSGIYIDSIRGPYGGYVLNQDIKLSERYIKPNNITITNRELYNLLSKAIKYREKCYIEYYSKEHDKMTKRVIRPYNLIALDNEWGVAAYCELKKEIRHFYLSRISNLEELNEKF